MFKKNKLCERAIFELFEKNLIKSYFFTKTFKLIKK